MFTDLNCSNFIFKVEDILYDVCFVAYPDVKLESFGIIFKNRWKKEVIYDILIPSSCMYIMKRNDTNENSYC